jgi:predicted dehydrogenase
MANKVRWGVISTARHGLNTVIPAIQQSASGEVVAIASRNAEQGRKIAAKNHIPVSYGSYEALLAAPDIDVIYNPLPNSLHKEWTIRALQAGKHVLSEKPFGLNAAEAVDMVAVARSTGRKLAETFQWRHHPQAKQARELIRSGAIGDLRLIEAAFSFPLSNPDDVRWDPALGGGALYDLGCYPISLTRYLTGQEPLAVTSQIHWNKSGVDDMVVATFEFPGEILATINCSFILPLRRYGEAIGTTGALLMERCYNQMPEYESTIVKRGPDREATETISLGRSNCYIMMAEDFNRAVLDDTEPVFPPEDAIANMRVIDAIFESARTGKTVKL